MLAGKVLRVRVIPIYSRGNTKQTLHGENWLAVSRREFMRTGSAALATFGVAFRGDVVAPASTTSLRQSDATIRDCDFQSISDAV